MSPPMSPQSSPARLHLTLFINGASAISTLAVRQLHDLCEENLPAGYDLEIIDVHQQPALVTSRSVVAVPTLIVAAPTLIKDLPQPIRLLVGDFADERRVLDALGLSTRED